jgi:acyl-CoA dehydrogenase
MRLADMFADIETAALTVYRAAWAHDTGEGRRTTAEASLAKLIGTESAFRVIDSAVQLFGGMGVTRGCIIEQLFRDIRAFRIYEGATEIQKLILGRHVTRSLRR